MLDMRSDETKLIDEILENIENLIAHPISECHPFFYWYNGLMENEEIIEKLLPLCKLLNKLFYQHNPALFDK